jgi:hypothetical protein
MTVHEVLEQALADFNQADKDIQHLIHTHKELLWKPSPDKWSAAQCVEHLIVSNARYFPILEKTLAEPGEKEKNHKPYKPTFWGRMIYRTVDPEYMAKRKSKTPKIFSPQPDVNIPTLLNRFEKSQEQMIGFLHKTMETDASKKIKSPAAGFIRFTLADAMAILSKHEIRHHHQALNVLKLRG